MRNFTDAELGLAAYLGALIYGVNFELNPAGLFLICISIFAAIAYNER